MLSLLFSLFIFFPFLFSGKGKLSGSIERVLYPSHIKQLKASQQWPASFTKPSEEEEKREGEEERVEDDEEDEDEFEGNPNIRYIENDSESESGSE
jgi:hypothetical protein